MIVCLCGEDIAEARLRLGFRTCLECGERDARDVSRARTRSAVPTHKSNYVPLLGQNAKKVLLDISSMRRGISG